MSGSDGFTDSTDWLTTPLRSLAPLDAALRCQVCKDFFTTPMITSCSHTFCSLCIRRYLSQEGRCPACREADQEIKLRRNWSIEEAVAQFRAGRDDLLKVARDQMHAAEADESRPKKRRKTGNGAGGGDDGDSGRALPERRSTRNMSTRSQSRRLASQGMRTEQEQEPEHTVLSSQEDEQIPDSDGGSVYEDGPAVSQPHRQASEPHDGLVACPICQRRMKEAVVNSHLDKCMAGNATPSPRRSNTPQVSSSTTPVAYGQPKATQQPWPSLSSLSSSSSSSSSSSLDRLPTVNYSLLNDNTLRKKLKDLGIPSHGSKDLMRKRHTEWINLWNANCDSVRPVAKQQLLRDLDRWERTLGRQIDGHKGPTGVMVKDFDRDGWQRTNKSDFDDLIRKAREKRAAVSTVVNAVDVDAEVGAEVGADTDANAGKDEDTDPDPTKTTSTTTLIDMNTDTVIDTDTEMMVGRTREATFRSGEGDGGGGSGRETEADDRASKDVRCDPVAEEQIVPSSSMTTDDHQQNKTCVSGVRWSTSVSTSTDTPMN